MIHRLLQHFSQAMFNQDFDGTGNFCHLLVTMRLFFRNVGGKTGFIMKPVFIDWATQVKLSRLRENSM
jgi:hypothetical protein